MTLKLEPKVSLEKFNLFKEQLNESDEFGEVLQSPYNGESFDLDIVYFNKNLDFYNSVVYKDKNNYLFILSREELIKKIYYEIFVVENTTFVKFEIHKHFSLYELQFLFGVNYRNYILNKLNNIKKYSNLDFISYNFFNLQYYMNDNEFRNFINYIDSDLIGELNIDKLLKFQKHVNFIGLKEYRIIKNSGEAEHIFINKDDIKNLTVEEYNQPKYKNKSYHKLVKDLGNDIHTNLFKHYLNEIIEYLDLDVDLFDFFNKNLYLFKKQNS